MPRRIVDELYQLLRPRTLFNQEEVRRLFAAVDRRRVSDLSGALSAYIAKNLPRNVQAKSSLADYRTSPYVLMASASVMGLIGLDELAKFLIDTKLYTSMETSFGKQIEAAFVGFYPIGASDGHGWHEPREKIAEATALKGLSREEKAAKRVDSVWREVDTSCIVGPRRYFLTIKSGPQCINDTQVAAMKDAIRQHHATWLAETRRNYKGVSSLDVVIGLTYGTPATTNNKENQILVKLRGDGFEEEDRRRRPGVLIDTATHSVRVYRAVGIDFWAIVGDPVHPECARHTFLEALLALSRAMSRGQARKTVLDEVQKKGIELGKAIEQIARAFPTALLPTWAQKELSADELVWLTTAVSSFFDQGV